MSELSQVVVGTVNLKSLADSLPLTSWSNLVSNMQQLRDLLGPRRIVHFNSTPIGGGVAESLHGLVKYTRAFGIDSEWYVISGDSDFYLATKHIHNAIHGDSVAESLMTNKKIIQSYHAGQQSLIKAGLRLIADNDIVIVHDPQPAGLVLMSDQIKADSIWRCHIGGNRNSLAWSLLREYLSTAKLNIFSDIDFVPDWMPRGTLAIAPPTLDPCSEKNRPMNRQQAIHVLAQHNVIDSEVTKEGIVVERHGTLPVPLDAPLVLQVSRWDPLKDMAGLIQVFKLCKSENAHLLLAGPTALGSADDPTLASELEVVIAAWNTLPSQVRDRVHIISIPLSNRMVNERIVNALQRCATVIVQKSLAEGFGLTVTEAMFKGKPVIASRVGGLRSQIQHNVTGIHVDPYDSQGCAVAIDQVVSRPDYAATLGKAAHLSAAQLLVDRSLLDLRSWIGELSDCKE